MVRGSNICALIFGLYFLSSFKECYAEKHLLKVLTTRSFSNGVGKSVKQIFEKKYNCKVKYIILNGSSHIINTIKKEKNLGDMVVGMSYENFHDPELREKLLPHNLINSIKTITPWTDKLLIPIEYTILSFIYNAKKVQNKFCSFDDLLSTKEKIILIDPRTSSPGLGFLLWLNTVKGDHKKVYLRKLKKRILTITSNWSEAYALFVNGEVNVVLGYLTSPAYHRLKEGHSHYKAAYFEKEGHYLQYIVAGVIKKSHQKKLALSFLEVLLSVEAQKMIITKDWSYPVVSLDPQLYPEEFIKIPKNIYTCSLEETRNLKEKVLHDWIEALS